MKLIVIFFVTCFLLSCTPEKESSKSEADTAPIKENVETKKAELTEEERELQAEEQAKETARLLNALQDIMGDMMAKRKEEAAKYIIDAKEVERMRCDFADQFAKALPSLINPYSGHSISLKLANFVPEFEQMAEVKAFSQGLLIIGANRKNPGEFGFASVTWCTSYKRLADIDDYRLCETPIEIYFGGIDVALLETLNQEDFNTHLKNVILNWAKNPTAPRGH